MTEWYTVKAKIISQKGHCEAGHKPGDEFTISDRTPEGMCAWAFYTIFPFASGLQAGGTFPWEKDKDSTTIACPDADNPVVFELRRMH